MNTLVVYYSRTGHTRELAKAISEALKCDCEEIYDGKDRSGPLGFIKSGREAKEKTLINIKPLKKDPSNYDVIIIGTPIWAHTIASPVRAFIHQYRNHLKKVAFFCTYGGTSATFAFAEMEELCGKKPVATLGVQALEIKKDYLTKVKEFVSRL